MKKRLMKHLRKPFVLLLMLALMAGRKNISAFAMIGPAGSESVAAEGSLAGTDAEEGFPETDEKETDSVAESAVPGSEMKAPDPEEELSGGTGQESTETPETEGVESSSPDHEGWDRADSEPSENTGRDGTESDDPENYGWDRADSNPSENNGRDSTEADDPENAGGEKADFDSPENSRADGTASGVSEDTGADNPKKGGGEEFYVNLKFNALGGKIDGSDGAPNYNDISGNGTEWSYSPGGAGTYPQFRLSTAAPKGWVEIRRSAEENWETFYEKIYTDEYSHDLPDVSYFGIRKRQGKIEQESAYNRKSNLSGLAVTQTGGAVNAASAERLNDGDEVTVPGLERGVYVNWQNAPKLTVRFHVNGGDFRSGNGWQPVNGANDYPRYVKNAQDLICIKSSAAAAAAVHTMDVYDDEYIYDLTDAGTAGFNLSKAGSALSPAQTYNTRPDQSGLYIAQSPNVSYKATAKRINENNPVTEDGTVTIYVAWKSNQAVNVRFNVNGGQIRANNTDADGGYSPDGEGRYPRYRAKNDGTVQVLTAAGGAWSDYSAAVPLSAAFWNMPSAADRTFGAVKDGFHIRPERHFNKNQQGTGLWYRDNNTKPDDTNKVTAETLNGGNAGTVTIYAQWESDQAAVRIRLHSNGGVRRDPLRGDEPSGEPFLSPDPEDCGSGGMTDWVYSFDLPYGKSKTVTNMARELASNYVSNGASIRDPNRDTYITYFYRDGYHPVTWADQGGDKARYNGIAEIDPVTRALGQNGKWMAPGVFSTAHSFGKISMESLEAYDGETVDIYLQWVKNIGIDSTQHVDSAGSSGVVIKPEGFSKGSSVYDGTNLIIPKTHQRENAEFYADGDLEWVTAGAEHRLTSKKSYSTLAEYEVRGSAYVLMKDRAYDLDGNYYDVRVTIRNISGNAGIGGNKNDLYYFNYTDSNGVCALQAYSDMEKKLSTAGVREDVKIEILDENGEAVNCLKSGTAIKTIIYFRDIDIPDKLSYPTAVSARWEGGENGPAVTGTLPYDEAVTLYAGTLDLAGGMVCVDRPHDDAPSAAFPDGIIGNRMTYEVFGDGSLRLLGSWGTGMESSNSGENPQVEEPESGFMIRTGFSADEGVSFAWSGSGCSTGLFDTPDFYKIVSNVVENGGDEPGSPVNGGAGYEEEGIVTFGGEGERSYPQGSSGTYTITPGKYYRVTGVWIDRVKVPYETLDGAPHTLELTGFDDEWNEKSGTGSSALTRVTYEILPKGGGKAVFGNVYANHRLDVSFGPLSDLVSMSTELLSNSSGSHTGSPDETETLTDTVTYTNLCTDLEYILTGVLADAKTGELLTDEEGRTITATTGVFTPAAANGTAELTFTLDARDFSERSIVSYEYLTYADGTAVKKEEDRTNSEQTVYYPEQKYRISVTKHLAVTGEEYRILQNFGEAVFLFRLAGTSDLGEKIELVQMITMPAPSGDAFGRPLPPEDVTFVWEDVPRGEYNLEEIEVSRYKLTEITGSANIVPFEDHAEIALKREDAAAVFTNDAEQFEKDSHNAGVTNYVG